MVWLRLWFSGWAGQVSLVGHHSWACDWASYLSSKLQLSPINGIDGSAHLTRLWSRLNEITQQSLGEGWMGRHGGNDRTIGLVPPEVEGGAPHRFPLGAARGLGGVWGSERGFQRRGWRREAASDALPCPPLRAGLTAPWWLEGRT